MHLAWQMQFSFIQYLINNPVQILGAHQFIDRKMNRKFVLDTQCNIIGGLSKWIDHSSDPLHSYLGILNAKYLRRKKSEAKE